MSFSGCSHSVVQPSSEAKIVAISRTDQGRQIWRSCRKVVDPYLYRTTSGSLIIHSTECIANVFWFRYPYPQTLTFAKVYADVFRRLWRYKHTPIVTILYFAVQFFCKSDRHI